MGHALLDCAQQARHVVPVEVNLELHGGGRCVVVVPHGEIDLSTAEELRRALLAAFWSGAPEIVVDFADVAFLDCAGLSALVATYATLGDQRTMSVHNVRPSVYKIFHITGLVETLGVRP